MNRLGRMGLFPCCVLLLLFVVWGSPVRAENSAVATPKITKPHHPTVKKVAAVHHKAAHRHLVAARARPAPKAPVARAHPTVVARARPHPRAAKSAAPIVLASAHSAPAETAEADKLAASLNRPVVPATDRSASDFVTSFLGEAFRVARSADGAPDRRRAELANLMTTRMDLGRILVYATHAAYQAASPEMQAQFRLSFASFLAEAYTPRIKLAAELAFTTADPRPGADGGIMVSTTFT